MTSSDCSESSPSTSEGTKRHNGGVGGHSGGVGGHNGGVGEHNEGVGRHNGGVAGHDGGVGGAYLYPKAAAHQLAWLVSEQLLCLAFQTESPIHANARPVKILVAT